MWKSKGKTCMVVKPLHVKQLSLNHVCKIGLRPFAEMCERGEVVGLLSLPEEVLIKIALT
jgi:hypothetical protein